MKKKVIQRLHSNETKRNNGKIKTIKKSTKTVKIKN